ncbi:Acetyltransferase [Madurella fahalii]|uniref:Acetyltransferase n=1 Tax=Madurella fahalii TaxID=1157608 RepID=A0ABQ0GEG6_9PEZI
MAFIRPFEPRDTENAKHICRATLPPSLARSPAAVTIAPYLWTLPFTHLFPRNCFVLDDGAGNAVGYVIGAPDVFALASEYPRYVGEVLGSETGRAEVPVPAQLGEREAWWITTGTGTGTGTGTDRLGEREVNGACLAQLAYKVEWLVLEGVEGKMELVQGWRAMMHIDLLEGWQGQGWGRKMIDRFVEAVRSSGCDYGKGIQIGVAGENTKVLGFYEKCGFRIYHGGEREGNVWMVKDL